MFPYYHNIIVSFHEGKYEPSNFIFLFQAFSDDSVFLTFEMLFGIEYSIAIFTMFDSWTQDVFPFT
jgi:hypothetical protein